MSVLGMAEQFAAALERIARRVPIERRADWLVLAARLVVLRAQLLFLLDPAAEAEAVAHDAAAVQRLADERARMRGAATWLAARPQLGQEVFTRPGAVPPRQTGYVALMEACLVVLRGREGRKRRPLAAVFGRRPRPRACYFDQRQGSRSSIWRMGWSAMRLRTSAR